MSVVDNNRAEWDAAQRKFDEEAIRKRRRIVRGLVCAVLVLAMGAGGAAGILLSPAPTPPAPLTVLQLLRAEMRAGCRPVVLQGITDDEGGLRQATRDKITEMATAGVGRISSSVGLTTSGDWYGLIVGYVCR